MKALGSGSGIDTASLAQSLVDAEKAPRADAINKNIKKNELLKEAALRSRGLLITMIGNLRIDVFVCVVEKPVNPNCGLRVECVVNRHYNKYYR
jgi:hypothetical protein